MQKLQTFHGTDLSEVNVCCCAESAPPLELQTTNISQLRVYKPTLAFFCVMGIFYADYLSN